MTELWLKFKNEKGDDQRVLVESKNFVIGRHSENELSIPNGKLSRQHVKIESFAAVFIVSDCGSSNGTTLNGENLTDPIALKDGDKLNLGGGLEIEVELLSDTPKAKKPPAEDENEDDSEEGSASSAAYSGGTSSQSASSSASSGSAIPTSVFIIAPILGIVILLCGGGLLFFLGGNNGKNTEIVRTYPTPDETPESTKESPTPKSSSTVGINPTISPPPEETSTTPTPEGSDELKKVELNSASFLRRMALNDPNAFLKTTEIEIVNSKLSGLKGSGNLAENIKAVKNNASQIEALAQKEGLKPQFLAAAALTEIGDKKGNPLEVAKTMLPIFAGLRISLANNLADDNLMMIAAYDQGKAGNFKDLRNALEALAKKNPSVSPREIRTIWFLKKQGKITEIEYQFALSFLAIGTIMQNPKDFNVNAEAITF
jgi:hypothetical protein